MEDMLRITSSYPWPFLFPELRKAYLVDCHLHPRLSSISLSQLHITIGVVRKSNNALRTSYVEDAAQWIEDYVPGLEELHVYPPRHTPLKSSHSSAMECIRSLIDTFQSTLSVVSLPPYYVDYTTLLVLMDCSKLRSITMNQFSKSGPLISRIMDGPHDNIYVSYGCLTLPAPLANNPLSRLTTLQISFPYAEVTTRLLKDAIFHNLNELVVQFTVLQPPLVNQPRLSAFSLAPFLIQLGVSTPSLEHLAIYMMPHSDDCNHLLANVPVVNWNQLAFIRVLYGLKSFQIYHVYPIEVSVHNVEDILRSLIHLRKLILNPHPVIMSQTMVGIQTLLKMAIWGSRLTHIGLFVSFSDAMMVQVPAGVAFRHVEKFYFGNSILQLDDDEYRNMTHALYLLFPKSTVFKSYPHTSKGFIPDTTFTCRSDRTLGVAETDVVKNAEDIWEEVEVHINSISDTARRIGATCNVREEDKAWSVVCSCQFRLR